MLVNNGYSNKEFDRVTSMMLAKHMESGREEVKPNIIKVFFKNTFHPAYKKDERVLKDIIKRNCQPKSEGSEIRLMTYYTSPKTSSYVISNNMANPHKHTSRSSVVYEFTCPFGDCKLRPES